jgi:hypothetical protein
VGAESDGIGEVTEFFAAKMPQIIFAPKNISVAAAFPM